MKLALYARVSTSGKGQDLETQLIPLREYAERRGDSFEVYSDAGVSGSKDRRPALDRLMTDARLRRFEAVVVARFDRFARSTKHLVEALDEFRDLKIAFISLNESIDTGSPIGRVVFTILAAVAQLERDIIIERINAGLERAKKQNKTLGPPRKIFDREKVRAYYSAVQSLRKTAAEFDLSPETVRRTINGS